jgi:glycosyltransferase involved in cell wall biosynthesis
MKLISVCLPSYNGEKFIEEQIESILHSPLVSELLVSDDGSSDATLKILKEISSKDCRLKILNGPQKGLHKNVEFLLKLAKGDYIFLSDQDDIWMKNKIPVMLEALKKNDLVVSDCIVIDKDKKVLFPSYFSLRPPKSGLFGNLIKNSYLGCCIAFKKSIATKAIPFPPKAASHDWWIGLIAETFGSVSYIHTPLIKYRRHINNLSSTTGPSTNSLMSKIFFRIYILSALVVRVFKSFFYGNFPKKK